MPARSFLCLDQGERWLRAVAVTVDGTTVVVERAVLAETPANVLAEATSPNDVESLGGWIAECLRQAGCSLGSGITETIVTLDREHASVRRIELPTDDRDELADMAKLAIQRETPAEAGSLVVDFVPGRTIGAATPVLIAASSSPAVERAKRLAAAAGLSNVVVGLRTFGLARLLREQSLAEPGKLVVAFDSSGDVLELVVLREGEVIYSRGVRTADHSAATSEAKRSWMGYRFSQSDESIASAVLFAPEMVQGAFASSLERGLGVSLGTFAPPSSVRVLAGVDSVALAHVWPLVGLALERSNVEATINLANPRKAPDLAARRRVRVLAAAGALVVAGLLGWTIGNLNRKSLESDVESLASQATAQLPSFHRFNRDKRKVEHLQTWSSAKPDWLDQARELHLFAPDPTKVVLDSFQGTLEASDVQFDRAKEWKIAADLKITLQGEAKDRATADAFRDRLIEDGRFTVTSTGADTEGGRRLASPFAYVLRSKVKTAAPAKGGAQ